jgi:hypothetical protein
MTTPAPPLSPAAQAVLIAHAKARCLSEWSSVNDPPCHPSDSDWQPCVTCADRRAAAATLIAAANQVVPERDEPIEPPGYGSGCEPPHYVATWTRWDNRRQLLAIATELRQEGQP